jgi:hypothetical protein
LFLWTYATISIAVVTLLFLAERASGQETAAPNPYPELALARPVEVDQTTGTTTYTYDRNAWCLAYDEFAAYAGWRASNDGFGILGTARGGGIGEDPGLLIVIGKVKEYGEGWVRFNDNYDEVCLVHAVVVASETF